MAESKNHAETYHRHGDADPSQWDEAEAVTGKETKPAPTNSSFADRAGGSNKAVQSSEAKTADDEKPAKRTTSRKSPAKSKG